MFVWLVDWDFFPSHWRIFHSSGDVTITGERLQILTNGLLINILSNIVLDTLAKVTSPLLLFKRILFSIILPAPDAALVSGDIINQLNENTEQVGEA